LGVSPDILVEQPRRQPIEEGAEDPAPPTRSENDLRGRLENRDMSEDERRQMEEERQLAEDVARLRDEDYQLAYALDILRGLTALNGQR
jgi:carboxyl-terminal processing protease